MVTLVSIVNKYFTKECENNLLKQKIRKILRQFFFFSPWTTVEQTFTEIFFSFAFPSDLHNILDILGFQMQFLWGGFSPLYINTYILNTWPHVV